MKGSGFVTRTISGAVLVLILLGVGYLGGYPLLAFCAFVGIIGLNELYKALSIINRDAEDKKNNLLGKAGILGTVFYYIILSVAMFYLFAQNFNNYINDIMKSGGVLDNVDIVTKTNDEVRRGYLIIALLFIIIMFIVFMAIYVFTFPRFNVEQVAYAMFSIVYVPVFMTFVYLTRSLDIGVWLFWLIFISSWVCDTCAYLVGCTIGKHRLAPVLSPKKSIEGSVGGVAGAVLVAFIFGTIQANVTGAESHVVSYMIICGVCSILSQIGDLCASAIKRNKEIKDYGKLIPGHGGILDRFDSVIFIAPIIYFLAAMLF